MVRMKMTALSLGYCAYSEADTAFSIVLTPAASPARVNLLVSIALIAASFVRNTNYDATHFARLFGPPATPQRGAAGYRVLSLRGLPLHS